MSDSGSEMVIPVSPDGKVIIPRELRDTLDIQAPGWVKFVQTGDDDIAIRPVESLRDLRGVLEGKTDEEGRSAIELLRAERKQDDSS